MPKLALEIQAKILQDRMAGVSVSECAAKYGVSKSTISKYHHKEETQEVDVPSIDLEARALELTEAPIQKVANVPKHESRVLDSFFKTLPESGLEPPPKADVPRGDPKELIQRIILNAETFPEVFPSAPTESSLANKSVPDLQGVLASMEHSRAVRTLSVQFKQVFLVASRATEVLGKVALRLKTDGMTDALMTQQKELDYLFRELAIKHAGKFSGTSEPEVRLLMMFGMTLLQTDATNRLKERVKPAEDKYGDL